MKPVIVLVPALAISISSVFARQAPDPREVFEIVRTNLANANDAQLQAAAVEGFLKELAPKVWMKREAETNTDHPASIFAVVPDAQMGYVRTPWISSDTAGAVRDAVLALSKTNVIKGLVFDLRFADGTDFAAAAAVADLFLDKEKPLLDWRTGSAQSTAKTNAITLPVAVIVNRQTTAAAEALAAVLRDAGSAVVLGTNTAGRAIIADEFVLKNGQCLCVAKSGLGLGSGAAIPMTGIDPDIEVAVNGADEKAFFEMTGKYVTATNISASGTNVLSTTNGVVRRRMNEADLVRMRKEGVDVSGDEFILRASATAVRPIQDPVLARAVDLLKGLAIVREWKGKK